MSIADERFDIADRSDSGNQDTESDIMSESSVPLWRTGVLSTSEHFLMTRHDTLHANLQDHDALHGGIMLGSGILLPGCPRLGLVLPLPLCSVCTGL